MFRHIATALLVLSLATPAEAKEPHRVPRSRTAVLATYPANNAGVTYQVERETCEKNDCQILIRAMKGGKEVARVPVVSVPGGGIEKLQPDLKATSPLARADTWAVALLKAKPEEGKTLVTIAPFALDAHEQGLLLRKMYVIPEEGLPTSTYTLVGWANGTVQELFSAQQSAVEVDLDVSVQQVGGEPEVVLVERAGTTEQIGRYGLFVRDSETGRFTRDRALFGVVLGAAEDKRGLESRAHACRAFKGAASARLLYGPSFPALGEAEGVAVAITTDEKEAKQWVEEITSCHKGTAPSVVRLK